MRRSRKGGGVPALLCAAVVALCAPPAGAATLTAAAGPGAWQTTPSGLRSNRLVIHQPRTSATEELFHAAAGVDLQPTGELPSPMPYVPNLHLDETPQAPLTHEPLALVSPVQDPGPATAPESPSGGSLNFAIGGIALLASRRWKLPMAQ